MCPIGEQLDRLCRQGWRICVYWDRTLETWYAIANKVDGPPTNAWSKESHVEALTRLYGMIGESVRGPAAAGGMGV